MLLFFVPQLHLQTLHLPTTKTLQKHISQNQQTNTQTINHHGPHTHNYRSHHHHRPQAKSLVPSGRQEDHTERPCHGVHFQKPHHWHYHHHQENHHTPQRRRPPRSRRQGTSCYQAHCHSWHHHHSQQGSAHHYWHSAPQALYGRQDQRWFDEPEG
jgi:hypothetical protein